MSTTASEMLPMSTKLKAMIDNANVTKMASLYAVAMAGQLDDSEDLWQLGLAYYWYHFMLFTLLICVLLLLVHFYGFLVTFDSRAIACRPFFLSSLYAPSALLCMLYTLALQCILSFFYIPASVCCLLCCMESCTRVCYTKYTNTLFCIPKHLNDTTQCNVIYVLHAYSFGIYITIPWHTKYFVPTGVTSLTSQAPPFWDLTTHSISTWWFDLCFLIPSCSWYFVFPWFCYHGIPCSLPIPLIPKGIVSFFLGQSCPSAQLRCLQTYILALTADTSNSLPFPFVILMWIPMMWILITALHTVLQMTRLTIFWQLRCINTWN